jgi:AmiR/NasT family two-component response regulator
MTEEDLALSRALTDIATISLLQERALREARLVTEQLQTALNNRIVIEQAKGIVAEQAGIEMEAAFDLMRAFARSHNGKLADVAMELIGQRLTSSDLRG